MATCAHPKCGKRLIPVRRPDGSLSDRHPTPRCDPNPGSVWWTDEQRLEWAATHWPTTESANLQQEARP